MKSEKRKYQKATWGYWKDYQEKLTKDRKGHKENQNVLGTEVSKEDKANLGIYWKVAMKKLEVYAAKHSNPLKKDGAVILDTTYQQDGKKCGSLKTQWEFQLWSLTYSEPGSRLGCFSVLLPKSQV